MSMRFGWVTDRGVGGHRVERIAKRTLVTTVGVFHEDGCDIPAVPPLPATEASDELTQHQSEVITVSSMTRQVVSGLAPAEIPVLDTYLAAYEGNPGLVRHLDGRVLDEATGLGGADASLTPYVVGVASSVLTFVAAQFMDAARAETGERIRRLIGRAFGRSLDKAAPAVTADQLHALTPAQLQQVRAAAYGKAKDLRLAESTAKNLADAVVGCLALHGD